MASGTRYYSLFVIRHTEDISLELSDRRPLSSVVCPPSSVLRRLSSALCLLISYFPLLVNGVQGLATSDFPNPSVLLTLFLLFGRQAPQVFEDKAERHRHGENQN